MIVVHACFLLFLSVALFVLSFVLVMWCCFNASFYMVHIPYVFGCLLCVRACFVCLCVCFVVMCVIIVVLFWCACFVCVLGV